MKSVSYTDNFIDIYKQLLEQERANNTIFISALFGIVVILIGATWWWNKNGATRYINKEIERRIAGEKKILLDEIKLSLKENVKVEFEKYETRMKEIEADSSRIFAIVSESEKAYSHAIYWWAQYLSKSMELKKNIEIRKAVNFILECIEHLEKREKEKSTDKTPGKKNVLTKVHYCEEVNTIINKLPDILLKEKKDILKRISDRMDDPEENIF
jgi:hypothetical protein